MKTTFRFFYFLMILSLSLLLSCEGEQLTTDSIVGNWEVVHIEAQDLQTSASVMGSAVEVETQQEFTEIAFIYSFKEDFSFTEQGSYIVTTMTTLDEETTTDSSRENAALGVGVWSLNGNILNLTYTVGAFVAIELSDLANNSMRFKYDFQESIEIPDLTIDLEGTYTQDLERQ